jgi:hypothetical protein
MHGKSTGEHYCEERIIKKIIKIIPSARLEGYCRQKIPSEDAKTFVRYL